MNPSKDEENSRKVCGHVVYLYEALGREVPEWARIGADAYYGDTRHLETAVVMLCETIRGLSKKQLREIVHDGSSSKARALADFWDEHLAADRRREEAERAKVEQEKRAIAAERERDEAEFKRLKAKLGK
jgi:hypothetical protein